MSLVAYSYDSGDSHSDEEEDTENMEIDQKAKPTFSNLTEKIHTTYAVPELKANIGHGLADENEDDLEDIVKPKEKQIADMVKPTLKSKQPVKIKAPALVKDDEEEPVSKKIKSSSTKCGLFDLLPTPTNLSLKEANRILVPHSLTKKTSFKDEISKINAPKTKDKNSAAEKLDTHMRKQENTPNLVGIDTYSDSDSEHEEESFFSLSKEIDTVDKDDTFTNKKLPICTNVYKTPLTDDDDSSDIDSILRSTEKSEPITDDDLSVSANPVSINSSNLTPLPAQSVDVSDDVTLSSNLVSSMSTSPITSQSSSVDKVSDKVPDSTNPVSSTSNHLLTSQTHEKIDVLDIPLPSYEQPKQTSLADLPLQFSGQHKSLAAAWNTVDSPFSSYSAYSTMSKMYNTLHSEKSNKEPSFSGDTAVRPEPPQEKQQGPSMEYPSLDNDAEFVKMQGRRGRLTEEVNVIDFDCNEVTGLKQVTKNISVEDNKSSKRNKKDDNPTSVQKRKHQITYLAFQAKEKELDLKNQWAQNRLTKRQTQSKYGF